jgi:DnaJ like chaperone protein
MNFRQFFATNTWWGKLLGGFFGYLMAGSAGALFGIIIGNFFDRGLASHFSRPHWTYHDEKREGVQKIFFEATFAIMGYIAKSDGRVSENEIQMARLMMDEMRLSRHNKTLAKRYFNEGKAPTYNIERMLTLLQSSCYDNPDLLKLFMDIQYRSAQVDGLSPLKFQALDDIFRRLGFAPLHQQYRYYEDFGYRRTSSSKQQSNDGKSRYTSTSPNALAQSYALLEIGETATKQEVKRAYRRSISRNHPDKLIAQGLPEAMIKAANDRTQKITKAYEQICESRGW